MYFRITFGIALYCCCLLTNAPLFAQTGTKGWEVLLPGPAGSDDRFEDILIDGNHLIVIGRRLQNGDETVLLSKYTMTGQLVWSTPWAIAGSDLHPLFVNKGLNGHYYVLGNQSIEGEFVAEFDNNGAFILQKDLGIYSISEMKILSDGSFVFGGAKLSGGDIYPYLFKFDQNLNPIWEKKIEFSYPVDDLNYTGVFSFDVAEDGGFYLLVWGSRLLSTSSRDDILVGKTDADGNLLWSKLYGGSGDDVISDAYGGQAHAKIVAHPDGGFVFNCYTNSTEFAPPGWPFSFDDILVFRCDASGTPLWWQTSQSGAYWSNGVALKPNGDILVYGLGTNIFLSPVYNPTDQEDTGFIFEVGNDDGQIAWGNSFGSLQNDFIRTVIAADNQHLFACGNKNGQPWLFSVNISLASQTSQGNSPVLLTLFPNPTNGLLSLAVEQGFSGQACVFDFRGKLVLELPIKNAIEATLLNVEGLPDGYYQVVLLDDAGRVHTGKFYKI